MATRRLFWLLTRRLPCQCQCQWILRTKEANLGAPSSRVESTSGFSQRRQTSRARRDAVVTGASSASASSGQCQSRRRRRQPPEASRSAQQLAVQCTRTRRPGAGWRRRCCRCCWHTCSEPPPLSPQAAPVAVLLAAVPARLTHSPAPSSAPGLRCPSARRSHGPRCRSSSTVRMRRARGARRRPRPVWHAPAAGSSSQIPAGALRGPCLGRGYCGALALSD